MVSIFYGTCLQGLYCALRCHVASYIILVYDVVRCRYVPPWWCVKFYTTMVHDVVWILGYVLWGTYLFYAQFWILDLFSKIQKFGRSGRHPSSVGLAVVRWSLSAFHVDVVNSFHVDVRIFCSSRVERFLYGARVRGSNPVPCNTIFFQGLGSIPGPFCMFTGPWDPWPMSLAPTIGGSVWLVEKENLHEEKII
jgi:hypothetical protein